VSLPVPSATASAAWRHAGLAVAGFVLSLLLPEGPARSAVEVVVFGLGYLAVRCTLRCHQPAVRVTWQALAVALAAFVASSVAEVAAVSGIVVRVADPLEAVLDVVAYAAVVVAALTALGGGRRVLDRATWTDAASLLLAAVLGGVALADGADELGNGVSELSIGLPLITAVVLVACVPLAMPGTGRSVSGIALLVAGGLTLIGFAMRLVDSPLPVAGVLEAFPLLAIAAVTLAARHPSVARLGSAPEAGQAVTAGRVVGVGATLLVSPVLMSLWAVRNGGNGYLLGAGTGLLTVLALWRLGRLNNEREQIRTALAASETRLRVLLENAADVIAIVGADGLVSYVSPAVQALLGRSPADVLGRPALAMVHREDRGLLLGAGDADLRLRHSDGRSRWVEVRVSERVQTVGVDGWVVNVREITDRKYLEDELRRQAGTDPLTGLVNRSEFWSRLAAATRDVDPAAPPAVLFVDLDDFKAVNDSLGHASGDHLLTAVAGRIRHCVRGDDVVARLGGDEFALLLAAGDPARVGQVAERVLDQLRPGLRVPAGTLTVTASVGGAVAVPGDTAEALLHRADTAMYTAKQRGKDSWCLLGAEQAAPTA
jgi:diguanylate cyclase (GGDEF)-like protein/PAS domain S-box-containing protein